MNNKNIVQARNPMTGCWVKINKNTAMIIGYKKTPYKNIPIIGEGEQVKKEDKC